MTTHSLTGIDLSALEAAHERYVASLWAFNRLRCRRDARGQPDYGTRLTDARRHAREAYAEWVMLAQLGQAAPAAG